MSIKKKKNPKLLQCLGNSNLVFRPAFLRGDKIRNQLGFAFGFTRPTTARGSEELQGPRQCSPKYLPAHCWCLESHQEMCSWLKMVPLLRLFLAFT